MVREFRSSGQTQEGFARRRSVKLTTLRNWFYGPRALEPQARSPVGFQEIRLPAAGLPSQWAAEISLEGGTVVRLRTGVDPQWVEAILQPFRQPC